MTVQQTCLLAKEHSNAIAYADFNTMNTMLEVSAQALRENSAYIIEENKRDIATCERGAQFVDRLMLNQDRIDLIAQGLEKLKDIPCPIGEILEKRTTESGLKIERVRVPFGVIGVIYEARPNVTADAIGLCLKSGNAVVLRGSKDAYYSNYAIVKVIKNAIKKAGFDCEFIQLLEDCSHEGALKFMQMKGVLDLLIPRGGAALIRNAVENATVPIIETGTGNCHVYIENSANIQMAIDILINAKTQRVSVCNACESLVMDEDIAKKELKNVVSVLRENQVEVRGDDKARKIVSDLKVATEKDFATEYLDKIISIKIVKNIQEAIQHINRNSTHHSESIITEDQEKAEKFLNEIDSAVVYHNASTRFTDGFEFGFGAEMGISTQKLHARGPMGLKELTSYKFKVEGNGQIRK